MSKSASVRRWLMPLAAFAAVWFTQYLWLGFFPERTAAQERWVSIGLIRREPWWPRYIHSQAYWMGFSYAISAAFAVWAFQEYRRRRCCGTRRIAIGGLTLSGALPVVGCFLVGCCGSPMLPIYLSLFGAKFLPLAKPLVAVVTFLGVAAGVWWIHRGSRDIIAGTEPQGCQC